MIISPQIGLHENVLALDYDSEYANLIVNHNVSYETVGDKDYSTKWEAKLDDEVRAVGVLPDGRLYAPGYKSGRMHVLDGDVGAQLEEFSFAQPKDESAGFDRRPTMAQDIVVADDGRVYVPHSQTNKDALPPVVAGYYSQGPAPAVSPGISTFVADDDAVTVEKQPALFALPDPGDDALPARDVPPDRGLLRPPRRGARRVGAVPLRREPLLEQRRRRLDRAAHLQQREQPQLLRRDARRPGRLAAHPRRPRPHRHRHLARPGRRVRLQRVRPLHQRHPALGRRQRPHGHPRALGPHPADADREAD